MSKEKLNLKKFTFAAITATFVLTGFMGVNKVEKVEVSKNMTEYSYSVDSSRVRTVITSGVTSGRVRQVISENGEILEEYPIDENGNRIEERQFDLQIVEDEPTQEIEEKDTNVNTVEEAPDAEENEVTPIRLANGAVGFSGEDYPSYDEQIEPQVDEVEEVNEEVKAEVTPVKEVQPREQDNTQEDTAKTEDVEEVEKENPKTGDSTIYFFVIFAFFVAASIYNVRDFKKNLI